MIKMIRLLATGVNGVWASVKVNEANSQAAKRKSKRFKKHLRRKKSFSVDFVQEIPPATLV